MNQYEEKLEARRDYYERKADEAERESNMRHDRFSMMMDAIPFGQPVHGAADRRYREKAGRQMDMSIEAMKKAEYYRRKAESVGKGGISSADPDAIEKLTAKLEACRAMQEKMKAANRAIRMKDAVKGDAKLREIGYSDEEIKKLREPDFCGRVGYPEYILTGNNAEIHRLEKRIQSLEQIKAMGNVSEDTALYSFRVESTHIIFEFDGKPEPAVRNILKRNGFKWSPHRIAWVRMVTENGLRAAETVKRELADM